MANTNAPRGFWPIRHLTGGVIRANSYLIANALASNIFQGDVVKRVTSGGIDVAAATQRVVGVFQGCKYTAANGSVIYSNYWPTGTVSVDAVAYVYDDPFIVFGVQSNGSTVAADAGELGDHIAGTGDTSTGLSGFELNGSTGTGYALARILGKVNTPDNDWGTNVNLEVQIYEHEYGASLEATTPGV